MKILYVEDNPANVFLVKRVARMGSHEIINYIDGDQALDKFDEISPSLVLMDIQLAGDKSGLDVVKILRERGVKTPIIAVTAYAMVGDKERCIAAGCTDYLAKPLPIQQLVKMFEHYSKIDASKPDPSASTTSDVSPQAKEETETKATSDDKKVDDTKQTTPAKQIADSDTTQTEAITEKTEDDGAVTITESVGDDADTKADEVSQNMSETTDANVVKTSTDTKKSNNNPTEHDETQEISSIPVIEAVNKTLEAEASNSVATTDTATDEPTADIGEKS